MNIKTTLAIVALLAVAIFWVPKKWAEYTEAHAPVATSNSVTVASVSAGEPVVAEPVASEPVIDEDAITIDQAPLKERIASLELELGDMRRELGDEKAARKELQQNYDELEDELAALKKVAAEATAAAEKATATAAAAKSPDPSTETHSMLQTDDFSGSNLALRTSFSSPNVTNLLAAGVDETAAQSILERLDAYALADLDLRDRAAREGWLDSADFESKRATELPPEVNLRAELGDSSWDNYLYSSGRANRVTVASVIAGSAASQAGIRPGDSIMSYSGERIFSIRELQEATRGGERGEVVTARFSRGDTLVDIELPRGPLGVSLSGIRVDPASNFGSQ